MKKTGFEKSFNFKQILITLAAGAAVLLPVRIYQLFAIIDTGSTGFYKKIDFSVYFMYVAVVVFTALLIVFSRLSDDTRASRPAMCKNKLLGAAAVVMAVGTAYDSADSMLSFSASCSDFSSNLDVSFMRYFFSNGMFASLFESIFGIIACVYFIVFALSYFNDKADFTSYKVLALAPLFWPMCKMITTFMTKISFINVSELMLEMLELALVMLFFMSFAKISSDVADKGEFKKLVSYGMPAAMLAAVIGVSRLVITLCGKRDRLPSELGFSLTDPAFAFFAIVYIRHQMKHGRPESEDNAPSEDETAAKADKIN